MIKIKTLFIGSGNFAIPILDKLLKLDLISVVGVVTQPDKPVGRKAKLTPCPVQKYALENEIKTYQPVKLKLDTDKILKETNPNLIIVADYGQIISKSMLDFPEFKCLNIHGSLLPDLRGAVPIPMAIYRGYKETGVSIPIMTPGLDDGDVIASRVLQIQSDDTTNTLKPKLATLGADLLAEILPKWIGGELKANPQDDVKATYVFMKDIAKKEAQFNANSDASQVERMVRAFDPWPITWCFVLFNGKKLRMKIFKSKHSDKLIPKGEIIKVEGGLYLGLSGGALKLIELQLEGKQKGISEDYLYLHGCSILKK